VQYVHPISPDSAASDTAQQQWGRPEISGDDHKKRMPNASEEWGQLNTDANVMVVIVVVIMVVLMAEVNDGGEL